MRGEIFMLEILLIISGSGEDLWFGWLTEKGRKSCFSITMGSGRKGNLMDRDCIPRKMVSISVSSKWAQEAAEAYNHQPEAYSKAIFKTD